MNLTSLSADIVTAYVSTHTVPADQLPGLIATVHAALAGAGGTGLAVAAPPAKLEPAVSVRKSITPEYIVCLEDGRRLKMLKRYLRTNFNLTPDQYREKWGLPADYPMVAPAYAQSRSDWAKKSGLGLGSRGRAKAGVSRKG